MSILIKGMEMPKTCEECALNYDSCACIKTGSRFFRDRETEFDPFKGRLEDCPLAPVPPHGDLIDRDGAMRDLRMDYAYAAARIVSLQPVIIPAEPPKEG